MTDGGEDVGWLERSLVVARFDLLRRVRSRSALIQAVLAPLVMAVVFGSLIGSVSVESMTIGVAAEDSPIASSIAEGLVGEGDELTIVAVDLADVDEAVDDGSVGSVIVLGIGDDGVEPAGAVTIETVTHPATPIAGQVAGAIAVDIARRIEQGANDPVDLRDAPVGGRPISALPYYGASMSILLGYFSVSLIARSLLEERDTRTLDRLTAGSTSIGAVIVGKAFSIGLLTFGGFIVVWSVTSLVFGAEWGAPFPVLVMIGATTLSMVGLGVFVGSFAKTPRQADTYAAVLSFVLAMLGGSFVPPSDTPEALRTLARFNPVGWSLDGFTRLSTDLAGLGAIATPALSLVGTGAVAAVLGLGRLDRRLQR